MPGCLNSGQGKSDRKYQDKGSVYYPAISEHTTQCVFKVYMMQMSHNEPPRSFLPGVDREKREGF